MTGSWLDLVRTELLRLRSRRAILLLLAAAVVAPLLIAIGLTLSSAPPSESDLARAERAAEVEAAQPYVQEELERCQRRPGQYGIDPEAAAGDVTAQCTDFVVPQPEWYLETNRLDLDDEREFGSGLAIVVLLGAITYLIGTTFAGHDWNTGSMSNQLLFEPRRLRVWTAKVLAVGIASAATAGLVLTAYWLGLGAVLATRGSAPTGEVLLDCLQQGWRGALMATVAGVGGLVLTMLSRSTVFSLGLLFGVSVAGGLLLLTLGPDDPGPVDPAVNALAIVSDGTTYYREVPAGCDVGGVVSDGSPSDDECDPEVRRSFAQGATWYAGLLLLVGAASAASFRRRDVP